MRIQFDTANICKLIVSLENISQFLQNGGASLVAKYIFKCSFPLDCRNWAISVAMDAARWPIGAHKLGRIAVDWLNPLSISTNPSLSHLTPHSGTISPNRSSFSLQTTPQNSQFPRWTWRTRWRWGEAASAGSDADESVVSSSSSPSSDWWTTLKSLSEALFIGTKIVI